MADITKLADKKAEMEAEKEEAYKKDMALFAELIALTFYADQDKNKVSALQVFLRENPDMGKGLHMLASDVKSGLLRKVSPGEGSRVLIEKEVEELRERLSECSDTPLEELLVDAALLCWVRVQYAEDFRSNYMRGTPTFREIELAEKMLTYAHNRFHRAVTALARVRSLTAERAGNHTMKSARLMKMIGS